VTYGEPARTAVRGLVALIASGILVAGLTTAQAAPRPIPQSKLPAGARDTSTLTAPVTDIAQLVDTRTWTTHGGNTFPGAEAPFGMTQWSPDTMPDRSAGGGYSYGDTSITGYSLTHLSGPGCTAAGDVPMLPMTGALPSGNPNGITTAFSNTNEIAQAGYYSAQSNQPDTITSEFTATPHTSMGRFTYPATTQAGFLIKLHDSQNGEFAPSTASIAGNDEVTGSETSGHFCDEADNDGQRQEYTVHFDITFDQPFTSSKVIDGSDGTPAAVYLTFDTRADRTVRAKAGLSYVSASDARLNWQTEIPGWNFDAVKTAGQRQWNNLLGRIGVSGGAYNRTQMFYSLLYKAFLHPSILSDVNGQYMGADMKVHRVVAGQRDQYGMYSGWDTYHSLSQLQAMLDPKPASDQAQSLLNYYAQDGILPQFGYLNLNNYVNDGDPAQAIIADYYAFGARDFDTTTALHDMLAQATTVNDVRPGEALEQKYGYLPESASYGCCNWMGGVPTLLEYDSADLALSFFARALGDGKNADMLEARANNWQNVFNPDSNLLNPRNTNGGFVPGITPASWIGSEGDAYEYLWNVPNNYPALFALLGGKSKVVPALREYLSQPNGGWPTHAMLTNEFDFGEQYALDYAGDPAGTQQVVNNIRTTMYQPGPSGLANNDDLGANSSAFIWAMLGMYPENSGSDNLVLNSPGFPYIRITLPSGRTITSNAPGASPTSFYVASLKLNGAPSHKLYVPFSTLARGSRLDWTLVSEPTTWGAGPQDAPPSYTQGMRPVVAGYLHSPLDQVTVTPGGTAAITLGVAANATNAAQTVQARASAPSGLTIRAATRIPPSGRGTITLTVRAAASARQGFYPVPITLSAGATHQAGLDLIVIVEKPGSLLAPLALDAGTATSDVYPGFKRLSPADTWNPDKGYGWVGTPPDSHDQGSLDALRRDLVLATTPATLRIAIPAGRHEVYLLRGDAGNDTGDTIISEGGTTLADPGDNLPAGQFQWLHFSLDGGSAGRTADLTITAPSRECNDPCYFGTGRNYWSVAALVVLP
jgi:predicted alpha-1,2-mannosidase